MKTEEFFLQKKMKKDYTILVPDMLPIHFNIMKNVLINEGYKIELLDNSGQNVKQMGLKYMHNDICYPAPSCCRTAYRRFKQRQV